MNEETNTILINFRNLLKDGNYSQLTVYEWVNIVSKEMLSNYSTTPYHINPYYLYRARVNVNETKKVDFFENANELWAPPNEKVKQQGRCNSRGQSILYCSTSELTSLFEIKPENNAEVTIIEYESICDIGLLGVIGVNELIDVGADYKTLFGGHHKHSSPKALLLDEVFSEIFKSRDKNSESFPIYNLTNAIFQIFLTNTKTDLLPPHAIAPHFKGIVYPSVTTRKPLGMNMALYQNEVKEILKPSIVYKYKILQKYDEHRYTIILTHKTIAIGKNGELYWEEIQNSIVENVTDIADH